MPAETGRPDIKVGDWVRRRLWKLTGGRPMKRTGSAFTDAVTRESVCYYTDKLGRKWLATSAWSLFRLETERG